MDNTWWQYAQNVMDDAGETRTESAKRVGIDLSNYTRWAAGTLPKPEIAVRFARAYHANVLQALVALGLISDDEARLTERTLSKREFLAKLTDIDLAAEILNRAHRDSSSMLNDPLEGRTLSVVADSVREDEEVPPLSEMAADTSEEETEQ